MSTSLLSVENLSVTIPKSDAIFEAVIDLNLKIAKSSSLAIVGESGSGKTLTALAIGGLLPDHISTSGDIKLGSDLISKFNRPARREIAGKRIGYIFQEPMSALHPILPIGFQIAEALKAHFELSKREIEDRVNELLDLVGLSNRTNIAQQRIGQLSGGMRQRVMIAMALSCDPELLIADEPTTALDVTLQRQIIELILNLQRQSGVSLLLITHDLGVVRDTCEKVAVMYAGQIVETGGVESVIKNPRHEYTRALVNSIPSLNQRVSRLPVAENNASWMIDMREVPKSERIKTSLVEIDDDHFVRCPE
jgi:ABC-type dipeptide/oligopeptide/nickel transport system ATPase component